MTPGDATFVVVLVLFVAALGGFVARDVIRQLPTHRSKPWLTWAAWSLAALWAASVVWRFQVLG